MLYSGIPPKFPTPFASAAPPGTAIRPIPTTPGPTAGAAALTTGFPPPTFIPPSAGGIPPDGRDFNGLFNQITAWDQWLQAGGPVSYDAAFASSIGGYPRGAMLASNTGHVWFQNQIDSNIADPNIGAAPGWGVVFSPWSAKTWTATGSANNQLLTISPTPLTSGQLTGIPIHFFSQGTNTGAVSLNINATGGFPLQQSNGQALGQGALVAGGSATVVYTGGNAYHLISQSSVFTDSSHGAGGVDGGVTIVGIANPSGANLALVGNGGTTPSKYIRARNGLLEIINNAYSAAIATLTDLGALTILGALGTGGGIVANAGDVTALTGKLRAGIGARDGSGQLNAATILGDFLQLLTLPGYTVFPNGLIIQWGGNVIPGNSTVTITYPLTFPGGAITGASQIGGTTGFVASPAVMNIRGAGSSSSQFQISNPNVSTVSYDWIIVGH